MALAAAETGAKAGAVKSRKSLISKKVSDSFTHVEALSACRWRGLGQSLAKIQTGSQPVFVAKKACNLARDSPD
jgi:hypothetical protein